MGRILVFLGIILIIGTVIAVYPKEVVPAHVRQASRIVPNERVGATS